MQLPALSVLTLLALSLISSSARAADAYAFVTQTTNASTLAYLDPVNGKEVNATAMGINTTAGAVYSADGTLAFVIENSQTVVGYSVATGKPAGTVTLHETLVKMAASPTSNALFVTASRGESKPGSIYEIDTNNFTATMVYQANGIGGPIALTADGKTIYTVADTGLLSISTSTFQQIASVDIQNITGITTSSNPDRVYLSLLSVAYNASTVALYDPQTQVVTGTVPADNDAYVAVSPDGSTFYTTSNTILGTPTLEQISAATLTVESSIVLETQVVNAAYGPPLAISPDDSTLAVVNPATPSVTVVSLPAFTVSSVAQVGNACGVAYPSAQSLAVTNCGADTVDVVDVTAKTLVTRFDAGPSPQNTLVAADGKLLFVSNPYGVWELSAKTGHIYSKTVFPPTSGDYVSYVPPGQLAVSANSNTLFATYATGVVAVKIYGAGLSGPVPEIPPAFEVSGIATSSDGKYLFVGGYPLSNTADYQLLLLNQTTGALITMIAPPSLPTTMLVSKDSSTLYFFGYTAAGGGIGYTTLTSFRVATDTLATLPVNNGTNLALSPDGEMLYTVVLNGGYEVEGVNTSTQATTFFPSPVEYQTNNVAVTPDGLELVVTDNSASLGVITIANPLVGNTIPVGGFTSGINIP